MDLQQVLSLISHGCRRDSFPQGKLIKEGLFTMYLHLGNDIAVRKSDIIAIFDLDNTSQSLRTREYLSRCEKAGRLTNASGMELPKSFVVCSEGSAQRVYLSQLNSSTLLKRSEQKGIE